MPKTVRVTEDGYEQIHEMADRLDVPVREVIDGLLESNGAIIGYCPDHGTAFTRSDIQERLLGPDFVRCPEKYQSCRGEERAHQDVTGGDNRIPVEKLDTGSFGPTTDDGGSSEDSEGEDSDG